MEFRAWRPDWFPRFTQRFTAGFLHERIWDRLVRELEGREGITVVDREPHRELRSGSRYLIRVKRHRPGDRISSYPTSGSNAFWSNGAQTFEGLESFSLALGYMWDNDARAVGEPVLSFRDGKENPIWAVQLRPDGDAATGFTPYPVAPDLPELDLSAVALNLEEASGS